MPQLHYSSAPYAPITYLDSARRLSAASVEHSAPLPVIDRSATNSTAYGDYPSIGDWMSVCSRKMPYMGQSNIEFHASGQQQFSIYPDTVINLGHLDNVYPYHFA